MTGLTGVSSAQAQFTHPGALSTQADLNRMAAKVAAGAQPWTGSWDKLVSNTNGWTNHNPEAVTSINAGGGSTDTYIRLARDAARAYQLALRFHGDGSTWAADKSVQIMNAWASIHTEWTGDTNVSLRAGLYGYQFACAGELMRGYGGWNPADFTAFKDYMYNRFYLLNYDFLTRRHGTVPAHYWANWEHSNLASVMAIGVLRDDQAMFDWAIDYFYNGVGNGNMNHAVTYVHPDGMGQWQESGRDQGHSAMGPQLLGAICEIAWNQGHDLYGALNNRFLSSVEYISKYNLWQDVPFSPYVRDNGHPTNPGREVYWNISDWQRGTIRAGGELVYNHYVNRMGMSAPYTQDAAEKLRPEGGGFNYGSTSGGFDGLGFTTLTHTRDPIAAGASPSGLRTTRDDWQVTLSWWGSAYAESYNVKRATNSGGPYETVAQVGAKNMFYVDAGLAAGTTYYYVVSANTPGGETANSVEASTIAVAAGGTAYQAENASYGGDAELITWTTNHNGTGSVVPHATGYIEWTGIDGGAGGPTTLAIRYALGGPNRTGVWTVNGVQHDVPTSSTGDWDSWNERLVTVTLNSGTNNTIRITSDGTDAYVYVDELIVKNSTASSPDSAPAAPSLSATLNGSQADLSWNAVANATSYNVKRATASGGPYVILDNVTTTAFTDEDLTYGATTYYYVVTALNSAGESASSDAGSVSMPPMDLTAMGGDGSVTLDWGDAAPGSDFAGFNVYRSTTSGSGYSQIATGVSSSAYLDNSVTNSTAYYYVVTAVDAGSAESAYSNEAMGVPAAPYQEAAGVLSMEAENGVLGSRWITGSDSGSSNGAYVEVDPLYDWGGSSAEGTTLEYLAVYNFNISASDNYRFWFRMYSDNAADDSFFWRIDGGSWNLENNRYGIGSWFSTDHGQVDSLTAGNHTLEIAYRENGTRLDKFVIQLDSLNAPSGAGPTESGQVSGDTTPPAAPSGLQATAGDGSVSLDWTDNGESDLANYTVYRSTTSGSGYGVVTSGLTSSAYADSGVTNGTTYYYVVTATDTSSNESANSAEVSATPEVPADVTPPAAPSGLQAMAGDGSVSLDWADNGESDLASYTVYRSTTSGSGYGAVVSGLTASVYADSGVTNGTTYYYVVTATDTSSNESANSAEVSATPATSTGAVSVTASLPGTTLVDQAGPTLATSPTFDMAGGNAVTLLFTAENSASSDAISATFAGQPMTLGASTNQDVQWSGIFYLINPTTTSGSFEITTSGSSASCAYSAISLANVSSVADIDAVANTSTGGTISLATTTTTDGGYVLGTAVNNGWDASNPPPSFISGDADQVLLSPVLVGSSGHLHTYGDVPLAGTSTNEYGNLVQRNAYVALAFNSSVPDTTSPTVNLTTASSSVTGPFDVTVGFSESVSGLDLADFSVLNGSAGTLSGSGADYTVNISPTADGSVSVSLPADSAQDAAGNGNLVSNTLDVTYTAQGAGDIHVESIVLETVNVGGGNKKGRATVTIRDNTGAVVSGADVVGTFSGSYGETLSATTDANGIAVLTTTGTKKGGVSFTFCVDDVVGALPYDSADNGETCDSL